MSNHRNPIQIVSNILPRPLLYMKTLKTFENIWKRGWLNTVASVLKMARSVGSIFCQVWSIPYISSHISIRWNPQLQMVKSPSFSRISPISGQLRWRRTALQCDWAPTGLTAHSTRKNNLRWWRIYNSDGLNSEFYNCGLENARNGISKRMIGQFHPHRLYKLVDMVSLDMMHVSSSSFFFCHRFNRFHG